MKRIFLFAVLLAILATAASAQPYGRAINSSTEGLNSRLERDSAFAGLPDMEAYKQRLTDSFTRVAVRRHVDSCTAAGWYNWPWCYLLRVDVNPVNDRIPYPSPTAQRLLGEKYGISMKSIMAGCLLSEDQILHDSLMLVAIRKKWGAGFFQQLQQEADKMDRSGEGLQMPRLRSDRGTTRLLHHAFDTADLVKKKNPGLGEDPYLIMRFEGGRLVDAYWSGINLPMGFVPPNPGGDTTLLSRLQAMNWQSPRYKNRPIDLKLWYSVRLNKLDCWDYQ